MTESTLSRGALIELEGVLRGVPAVALDELDPMLVSSNMPVISTRWPTCGVSFVSSPSSRYVKGAGSLTEALELDNESDFALFRMNLLDVLPFEPVVPLAPPALGAR